MSRHRHNSEFSKDKSESGVFSQSQAEGLVQGADSRQYSESPQAAPAFGQSGDAMQAEPLGQAGNKAQASFTQTGLADELEALRKENSALKSEVEELNAKYLRKLADEVNFRKRMLREKEDGQKYALSSILADLIPILDDFDRGINAALGAHSFEQLNEGMILIKRQLSQMLENKYALTRFDSMGGPFDPAKHEALYAEPADVEEPVVSEEYLPGYLHHDRVLRSAKVRVKVPDGSKKTAMSESELEDKPGNNSGVN